MSDKKYTPCIGKYCANRKTCPRHTLMEVAVDTVLNDVRDRLVNGDVDMAEFCKMWKGMRGEAVEHVEHNSREQGSCVQRAVHNCNPPPENIVSGPFSNGCFSTNCH